MKFMKPCRPDFKILLALQQDVRACTDNLIYDVRLPVNVEDRLAKIDCSEKNLQKMSFVSDGHCTEGSLNLISI